ncbi:MAG: sn-glycerol-3-phosphate ABC transporter ATP-binding protein UgpC [Deltaproteobacteria bacterium]|nr:sn-glycerol-3-phosphate ABC transporter ATP-binding protein UgpC [Deltaproteobacteria bacterium]
MAGVRLEGVGKKFDDVEVLKPIDLEISDGEFLVLLGPSGCGKSTTLRILAGLETPTSGALRIGGRDVTHVPPKDRDIAMVFQSYALYPHLTVRQNLAFGLEMRKTPKDEIQRRTAEAAEILGLEKLLDRKPKALSGGQRQRVAMGRAIVRRPSVFLFDEPLSNLDAALRTEMRAEIKKLHAKLKTTVVYVTHDQIEAMTLADRIVVLHKGVLQQSGPPLEVYARPKNAFVAQFLGSPSMNQLSGRVERGPKFVGAGLEVPLPDRFAAQVGRDVVLGFRPQAMTLGPGPIKGRIELVEPTGSESFVRLELASGQRVTARVEGGASLPAGSDAAFAVAPADLYVFERSGDAGGEAIS